LGTVKITLISSCPRWIVSRFLKLQVVGHHDLPPSEGSPVKNASPIG